ncbi:MAG: CHAT domain-containing protein [Bacteroidetes bacterium]|nr:MAG: CHAT domain-containing protein [Bacteroidota bacterium]
MMKTGIVFLLIASMLLTSNSGGANILPSREKLDSLVNEQAYQPAHYFLQMHLDHHVSNHHLDSLANYIYLSGKINTELSGTKIGIAEAEKIIQMMKDNNASPLAVHNALIDFMHFLDEYAMVQKSYEVTLEAADIARSTPGFPILETANNLYFLGAGALALGKFKDARKHFDTALSFYLKDTLAAANRLPDAYNAMGAMMWSETKLDSARYYFDKSRSAIQHTDKDSLEKSYLTAIAMSNIGLIQQSLGRISVAITTLEETLRLYNRVIQNSDDDDLVFRSMNNRLKALTSLASIQNELGNFQLANVFLRSVHELQKEISPPGDPALFRSMTNMGESQMSLREFERARQTFLKALHQIAETPGEFIYWKAIATVNLAQTESALGNDSLALLLFEESKVLFEKSMDNTFNRHYLHLMGKRSKFLSKIGKHERALEEAEKTLNYLQRNTGRYHRLFIQHMLNIAEINLQKGDIHTAWEEATKTLEIIEQQTEIATTVEEQMQAERYKPMAILVRNKASYKMHQEPDTIAMLNLLTELQHTDSLLNYRKIMFPQKENVNALIDENREFYEWMKFITVQLYIKTGNNKYLNSLIDLKEQSIYNAIRLEFFRRNDMAFHSIPDSIIQLENELLALASIASKSITQPGSSQAESMEYFSKWKDYLSMVRSSYPEYYNLRFGQISHVVDRVQDRMAPATSIIRYMFIDKELHAFIITSEQTKHFNLGTLSVTDSIALLNTFIPEKRELSILETLYQQLWKPLEDQINTRHVVIIPDGSLFNLSFASLPTSRVKSYRDLAKNSLIKKHHLSYDFALSLQITQQNQEAEYPGKYIAFVPGFSSELKEKYLNAAHEPEDKMYLSLLYQPFIIETAKHVRSRYGGRVLAGEASTRSGFLENAAGHTIMHIGTHAEINNISPAFSRMFFAKTAQEPASYLFAWEIYNYHLPNHLTILTACDTGKPTYQPGEGMTSLAHAFHYAGSQSLLMSLWKIDEQSSSFITQMFFDYLAKGYNKAQALAMAQADYLENARGRTLAPVYWAGIVITGDNSPVDIKKKSWNNYLILIFAGLFIIGMVAWSVINGGRGT